jgi:flavorubredoxin
VKRRGGVDAEKENLVTDATPYGRPIRISEGVFWVGSRPDDETMSCNPYLVVEKDQVVLIDSGSRGDFAVVMMRILQAGIDPGQIVALIYQHYDPDLCGSMPNFIDMCDNTGLKVVSEHDNNLFISYYIPKDQKHLMQSVDAYDHRFVFSGRELMFLQTPYSHSPGSFVTYDVRTKTLFSSDLFGSFDSTGDLFMALGEACYHCTDFNACPRECPTCPLKGILQFHQQVMPCGKALHYAMDQLKSLDIDCIAPQHGSIINGRRDIDHVIARLEALTDVGIDRIC